ncbi:hypothetical protein JCM24511_02693 [Saitozyma sp. JCM 24511]|nr:hypothetical protein JCM24511_02693 [Saitozyma sp. JCM 24511]
MASKPAAPATTPVAVPVPSEDVIARKVADLIVNSGIGFGVGVVASVLLFRPLRLIRFQGEDGLSLFRPVQLLPQPLRSPRDQGPPLEPRMTEHARDDSEVRQMA